MLLGGGVRIAREKAPPLGDIRSMQRGDVVVLVDGVTERRDWPRYADAIIAAVSRGAEVRWSR